MPLDRVLADLACDCPHWRTGLRRYDPRCGARFEDLDRLRPVDMSDEPVHRQRVPAREDLPQRRLYAVPETPERAPMLSDWTSPQIVVACDKCGRREVFLTAAIRASAPDDTQLTDLHHSLTADCPRAKAKSFSDWCAGVLVSRP